MPYTDSDIMKMSPDQKQKAIQEIEQELQRRNTQGVTSKVTGGVMGGITGALRGLSGQAPKEQPEISPIDKMILASQLKGAQPTKYEPTTMEEALEFEKAKAGIKSDVLTPAQKKLKSQKTEELVTTVRSAPAKIQDIEAAETSAQHLTEHWMSGRFGRIKKGVMEWVDPNAPLFTDWQNVKMILTDKQLMDMGKMKGAVSDAEEAMLAAAAANDDVMSIAKMKPVFDRLIRAIKEDVAQKKESYTLNYGEDPDELLGTTGDNLSNLKSKYGLK